MHLCIEKMLVGNHEEVVYCFPILLFFLYPLGAFNSRDDLYPRLMGRKAVWLWLIVPLVLSGVVVYLVYRHFTHGDHASLVLYGNVDIRQVEMSFRVDGRIDKLLVDEGDAVQEGMLLATLERQPYEDLVKEAEANLLATEANLMNAELLLQRRLALLPAGAVSKEECDDALAQRDALQATVLSLQAALGVKRKNLEDTAVVAPTDGWILTRILEPGSVVKEGTPFCTLSVKSPVWVRAYVDEPQLGLIYFGMPAKITTDTQRLKVYDGHIGFISTMAEFTPKTVESKALRTDLVYRLRVIIDNPDDGLKQGMPVTVTLVQNKSWKL